MTVHVQVTPDPMEFVQHFHDWLFDPHRTDDPAEMVDIFEGFATTFTEYATVYTEFAAWCRLAVGLLRGEDVPLTIHAPLNEDPAKTARWQKWRLS